MVFTSYHACLSVMVNECGRPLAGDLFSYKFKRKIDSKVELIDKKTYKYFVKNLLSNNDENVLYLLRETSLIRNSSESTPESTIIINKDNILTCE